MGAVLQLERFDRDVEVPPAVFAQADLEAAFNRGVAEGRSEAEARGVAQLCEAFAGLSQRLEAEQAARASDNRAEIRAIAPLIGALLDGVIPAAARARLESSLLHELLQLAGAVPPLGARVRCGPDLGAFAAACLAAMGLTTVELDVTGRDGIVEAELWGGHVAWDVALIAGQLRDLVNDMMEVE